MNDLTSLSQIIQQIGTFFSHQFHILKMPFNARMYKHLVRSCRNISKTDDGRMVTLLNHYFPQFTIPLFAWAGLIGFSRVMLGVHFPQTP